ncbi:MAG TPA: class I SAM-dependent methyltransferase [Patescibacteria group bacterium]
MKNTFNEKKYWIDRLKRAGNSLQGVGHKRFSQKTNMLMYKKVIDTLSSILKNKKINLKNTIILDAGAGIGVYAKFYLEKKAKIVATDISSDALMVLKKTFPNVKTIVSDLDQLDKKVSGKFYIVHCFDVLFHLLSDKDWKRGIKNLARKSNKYIIIHDKVPFWGDKLFSQGYIKIRNHNKLSKELKMNGFKEIGYYPTHILFIRPPIHLLTALFPNFFFWLDNLLIKKFRLNGVETSGISIFEKI